MKAKLVHYEGRVQGVGFRYTVKSIAKEFDVTGTVRNLPDGRVELRVQADDGEEVAAFLAAIRESHLAGHIQAERVEPDPETPVGRGFQIVG